MNWTQVYDPLGHWWLSTLVAALPIIVLFTLLAGLRVKRPRDFRLRRVEAPFSAQAVDRAKPAGGFRISGIKLSVSGSAHGVSAEDFAKIANDAKAGCPVSKALTGTTITLEVS